MVRLQPDPEESRGTLGKGKLTFHAIGNQRPCKELRDCGWRPAGDWRHTTRGAGRNRTLGIKALESIGVPVRPIEDQRRFDALCEKVRTAGGLGAQANTELDALLPAILDRAFKGEL
jgi:hypothetical protein